RLPARRIRRRGTGRRLLGGVPARRGRAVRRIGGRRGGGAESHAVRLSRRAATDGRGEPDRGHGRGARGARGGGRGRSNGRTEGRGGRRGGAVTAHRRGADPGAGGGARGRRVSIRGRRGASRQGERQALGDRRGH